MFYQRLISFLIIFCFLVSKIFSQNLPTPKKHFGFSIGDNYQLATFTQTEVYFKKPGASSDRAK